MSEIGVSIERYMERDVSIYRYMVRDVSKNGKF